MAKPSRRARRSRHPGVVVKIQRVKTTVAAIVNYILDVQQKGEKLMFPPWLKNIRLPQPTPGKMLTRVELGRALTDEIERNLIGLQTNRKPAVEIIISLPPGVAWSPRQWEAFWERFLYHLGRVTYVTDHCVRRRGLHQPRVRPPQFIPADFNRFMAVVVGHNNSGSEHLQPLVILFDPILKQVGVINDGFEQVGVQWAARRAEEDLFLQRHPQMPDYLAIVEGKLDERTSRYVPKDGRLRVVDPKLVKKVKYDLYVFHKKREPEPDKIPAKATLGAIMRHTPSPVFQLRTWLEETPPERFPSLMALGRFLESHNACLLRHPRTAGLQFCVDGSRVKPRSIDAAWSSPKLFARWPKLKQRGQIIGRPPAAQQRILVQQNLSRLAAAGFATGKPSQQQCAAIIQTALAGIDRLPWQEFIIEERRMDGTTQRCGELTAAALKNKIHQLFAQPLPKLNLTLHFRPVLPPGQLLVPLWDLTRANADRLRRNYDVALLTETEPGRYSAMILVAAPDGEPWEKQRALRRLTYCLAKRYQASPEVVAADGLPLPALPQLATTGQVVGLVGEVHGRPCQHASRWLALLVSGHALRDQQWAQGTAGWVLRQPEVRQLPKDWEMNLLALRARKVYLENVKAIAGSPVRSVNLEDLNRRVAVRMKGRGYRHIEIAAVFAHMQQLWPRIVPEDFECLNIFELYRVNYLRNPKLFQNIPAPFNPPTPVSREEFIAKITAPPTAPPAPLSNPDFTPIRKVIPIIPDFTPPPLAGPIAPDQEYVKFEPPTLTGLVEWGLKSVTALLKKFALEKIPASDAGKDHQRRTTAAVADKVHPAPTTKIAAPADKSAAMPLPAINPVSLPQPILVERAVARGRTPPPPAEKLPVKTVPTKTVTTPPIPPAIAPEAQSAAEKLVLRKRAERQLRLLALAGKLISDGNAAAAIQILDGAGGDFQQALVFEKLWNQLATLSDPAKQRELRNWVNDFDMAEPWWLPTSLATHALGLDEELKAQQEPVEFSEPVLDSEPLIR